MSEGDFYRDSSGAMIHPITITSNYSNPLIASTITWQHTENNFLRIKIINLGSGAVNLTISTNGLQGVSVQRNQESLF
ncbi:hypothetical protein PR202_gb00641 [Eleusine coracana subsp. coracana]|uniref:Uncharacterized protein n=1 Tax=Eleusine coracana subsp. coracana TaxID=191504 RepID=A0AAV5DUK6_ELECO|nr:hypothetical protein PR202_gb00641 [Eleusine coracana subsp. coracana]